jgi:hypothetical protein
MLLSAATIMIIIIIIIIIIIGQPEEKLSLCVAKHYGMKTYGGLQVQCIHYSPLY